MISGVRALALAPYLEPRGVYFILVLSTGEEAENESGGASIAPHARPRMRIAALPSHRIDPAGRAAVRPPHTRAVASPPLPLPPLHRPAQPQRRTRPARPLVGLTSSSAAPSAATVEVAAAGAADELVGPKRRRATTLTRHLPTCAGVNATQRNGRVARHRVARRRRRCHCRRLCRHANRRSPRHRPRRLPSRRHRRPCRRGLSCPRWSTPRLGTAATAATVLFRRSPVATAVTTAAATTPAAIFAAIADAVERGGV